MSKKEAGNKLDRIFGLQFYKKQESWKLKKEKKNNKSEPAVGQEQAIGGELPNKNSEVQSKLTVSQRLKALLESHIDIEMAKTSTEEFTVSDLQKTIFTSQSSSPTHHEVENPVEVLSTAIKKPAVSKRLWPGLEASRDIEMGLSSTDVSTYTEVDLNATFSLSQSASPTHLGENYFGDEDSEDEEIKHCTKKIKMMDLQFHGMSSEANSEHDVPIELGFNPAYLEGRLMKESDIESLLDFPEFLEEVPDMPSDLTDLSPTGPRTSLHVCRVSVMDNSVVYSSSKNSSPLGTEQISKSATTPPEHKKMFESSLFTFPEIKNPAKARKRSLSI